DRILRIRVEHAEVSRDPGIEEPDVLRAHQLQQLAGFLVRDDELDLDRQCPGKLKETGLMQHVMTAESRHGAKGGAAPDSQFVSLLEEPFPEQLPVVAIAFVYVESQERSFHFALLGLRVGPESDWLG